MKKVAIIMGSDSDFPVVSKAVTKLKEFGVPYEVHVMSAHRTPDAAIEFSGSAKKNGFGVIIAAAGMAAHLAGVLAAGMSAGSVQAAAEDTSGDLYVFACNRYSLQISRF